MKNTLKVEHLEKYYGNKGNITRAIDDISFDVAEGEYIGIMGVQIPHERLCHSASGGVIIPQ